MVLDQIVHLTTTLAAGILLAGDNQPLRGRLVDNPVLVKLMYKQKKKNDLLL